MSDDSEIEDQVYSSSDEEFDTKMWEGIALAREYLDMYYSRRLVRTPPFTGSQLVADMFSGHYRVCYDSCRMSPEVFQKLSSVFKESNLLRPTRYLSVDQQLQMFLEALGHGHENRILQHIYQHRGETISWHFDDVLTAMCIWACDEIKSLDDFNDMHEHILNHNGGKYYPYFKNCVGALGSTHVHAIVSESKGDLAYRRERDPQHCTQNVLGIVDFNMRFTFMVSGWEGNAHDCRVLNSVVFEKENNFPFPPEDKYYLVGAAYPNRRGFLAPYKGTRYHMSEFKEIQPQSREEHFNKLHSCLRHVVDRSFRLLKKRWDLLNTMFPFPYERQAMLVCAAAALHNFIIEQNMGDELLINENGVGETRPFEQYDVGSTEVWSKDNKEMGVVRDAIRDEIVSGRNI